MSKMSARESATHCALLKMKAVFTDGRSFLHRRSSERPVPHRSNFLAAKALSSLLTFTRIEAHIAV